MKIATPTAVLLSLSVVLAACGGGGSDPTYVVRTFSDYSGDGTGMAFDSAGNLYVADHVGHRIVLVTPAGVSSVFSNDASLAAPRGIAIDASDNLYVCNDTPAHDIVKITQAKSHSVFAGTTGTSGSSNSAPVTFNRPYGLALDRTGQALYVADSGNSKIRKVNMSSGAVTDFAAFSYVYGVAVDADGYVYASSDLSDHFAKYTSAGAYENGYTLSGLPATSEPYALTVDSAGNVLVADYANHVIWKVDPAGHASVLAGTPGVAGLVNGRALSSQFHSPRGIAVDSMDRIYVFDGENKVIRRIALE